MSPSNDGAAKPGSTPAPFDWLMVGLLGFVWGGTFLGTELALRGITPFWLVSGRLVFAALLLTALLSLRGIPIRFPVHSIRQCLIIVLIGILSLTLPFSLLSWGQQYVTSGFAGVSMASVALFVLPLAHLFLPDEQLNREKYIGIIMGFVGVVFLFDQQVLESSGRDLENFGRIACLGAALCYAVSGVLMKRMTPVDPFLLATLLLIVGVFTSIPVAMAVEGPPPVPAPDTLLILAVLGLIPTAAANTLRVLVISRSGPTFMGLANYQIPVWSVVLGAAILSEPLPPSLLLALALILSGTVISQWRSLRKLLRL